jgi:hypothetical protein
MVLFARLAEALRSLGGAIDADELERVLGGARPELARLVPELGGAVAGGGVQAAFGPAGLMPNRLFELLLGVLHRLAERGPLLLVVEDLHWADQSTRDLLGFPIRNLRAGVALVSTYRSDELHRRHPLRPYLAELNRSSRAERIELRRLGRGELSELLASILGEPAPAALVADIMARSESNPFFAEELLAARASGAGGPDGLPEPLRELLLARMQVLPEDSQRMLQIAAVAGRRVDHELLAQVSGQPPESLVQLLREAVAHHILVVEGANNAYAFRHALVQEAIYDDLLPVQRPPLHAAYARQLAARIDGETAPIWGGWPITGTQRMTWGGRCWPAFRAGQAAEAAFAPAEALEQYERALELWDQAPDAAAASPLDRISLLQRTAQLAPCRDGDCKRSVALINQALAEAEPASEPLRTGGLMERLAFYQWHAGDPGLAMSTVERAIAIIPGPTSADDRRIYPPATPYRRDATSDWRSTRRPTARC